MGMQSLRFGRQLSAENQTRARPPLALTFGICLLVGAATVAMVLAAVEFGLFEYFSKVLR